MVKDLVAERTCIVTRQLLDVSQSENGSGGSALIRFVAGPDGQVVPDLKRSLPGRGVWVCSRRAVVEEAVKKNAFARGLKAPVKADEKLPALVETLMEQAALGALGFARKAGECVTGSGKVESLIRDGKVRCLLHASDGADDGLRKLAQAVWSAGAEGVKKPDIWRVFDSYQMNLALGATNVIHAALTLGGAAQNCCRRIAELAAYSGAEPSVWKVRKN